MLATDNLGAVSRTVLETIRTLMVWLLNLLLYYAGRLATLQFSASKPLCTLCTLCVAETAAKAANITTSHKLFVACCCTACAGPKQGARLGEPWTSHSWLQAVGFIIVVAGTLLYGKEQAV